MRIIGCLALLAAAAGAAHADEVVMKNGDKITGTLVDLVGGKLKVKTAHSGVIVLEWKEVASLKTDGPVRVKLTSGDIVEGKVAWSQDGKLVVDVPGAGPREVPADQLKAFNAPPAAWHGGGSLAAKAADGNTHTSSVMLTVDASRETDDDRLTFKAVFQYEKTKDVLTDRKGFGTGKYDYFLGEGMFAFGLVELQSDRFKDLRLRTTVAAGVGATLIKEPETDLWADIGPAWVHNDFLDSEDESHAAIRIGGHLRQALPWTMEIVDDFIFTPNLEEGDNWTLRNDLALTAALGQGWSFKTGVITDFDNDPPDDTRKYDNTYYLGLGYRF